MTASASVACVALTVGATPTLGAPRQDSDRDIAQQEPFLCTTELNGLGQPTIDNDDNRGTRVYPESAPDTPDRAKEPDGWSQRCQADERVEYRYRDTTGEVHTLAPEATELPTDISYLPADGFIGAEDIDLGGGAQVPYLFRYQRGTLPRHRFIYSIAMLVPSSEVAERTAQADESEWDHSLWNDRLVMSFGGGDGIGHSQGSLSNDDSQLDEALRAGHAVVYSSGTRTSVHYNLLLAGRAADELKSLFAREHAEPRFTVGIGGSGGGIQQYVYAQNIPSLLDGLIPQYSYPDMTTQTINIGDCELLEYYMDITDGENPRWRDWDNRKLLQGQNTIEGFTSDWQTTTGARGSSECIEGWRGATPLALNPTFGLADGMDDIILPYAGELLALANEGKPAEVQEFTDLGQLLRQGDDPEAWVSWTHWDDAAEACGVDPETGDPRVPWDNVGVQYGLRSVAKGQITPDEFLDLNQRIGSWKPQSEDVPESCGMVSEMAGDTLGAFAKAIGMCEGDDLDRHSSRQMQPASSGDEPTPRHVGDVDAITNAFESGLEFDGSVGAEVPIIDVRHYLEEQLDMHNVHQSFVVRERIRRTMGNADSHVIWWMDARPDVDEAATSALLTNVYRVMDEWLLAIEATPGSTAADTKPDAAVDGCWDTDGTPLDSGDGVWDGAVELALSGEGAWTDTAPAAVDGVTVGACAARFPINSTSRFIAGGPITNDVYKCHLKSVRTAVSDGDYGEWTTTGEQTDRLESIFPDGVCDWSLRSVGYPGDHTRAGRDAKSGPGPTSGTSPAVAWALGLAALAAVVALMWSRRRSPATPE